MTTDGMHDNADTSRQGRPNLRCLAAMLQSCRPRPQPLPGRRDGLSCLSVRCTSLPVIDGKFYTKTGNNPPVVMGLESGISS